MSQIKGSNTKPEKRLRQALWQRGLRYRTNKKLPGKPDLTFAASRTVVFVDGCFWHGCPLHYRRPRTATEFWVKKINANMERDRVITKTLMLEGWHVIRLWEHEINEDLDSCVAHVVAAVRRSKSQAVSSVTFAKPLVRDR